MAENFTDGELAEWLEKNKHEFSAFVSRSEKYQGKTAQGIANLIKFLQAQTRDMEARSNASIQEWKTWRETCTSVITFESEKAKHYTNLISMAGYAGFFWLWNKVTPMMPHIAHLWTGILVTISLGIFVFSEIFVMWATGTGFLNVVKSSKQPQTLSNEIEHYNKVKDRFNSMLRLIWPIHFWLATAFGLTAFIFLLWYFILALIEGQFLIH